MRVCKPSQRRQAWMRKRASIVDQMRFMSIADQAEREAKAEEEYTHIEKSVDETEIKP
jgi:hypothetical protein